MAPVKLFLDEDVRPLLADILCQRGYDAVGAAHVRRLGLTDPEQLHAAMKEGRAFVTHNIRDFVRLHSTFSYQHNGIIVSNQETLSVILRRLLCFLSRETVTTTQGKLFWLSDYESTRQARHRSF